MSTEIEAIAKAMRRRFRGAGVRIGDSSTVHAAEEARWLGGTTIPAPACHSGFAVDITRLHPAWGQVTCGRCRHRRVSSTAARVPAGQLTLIPGSAA